MANFITAKLESNIGTEEENVTSYAKRVFDEQRNRVFVHSLVAAEKHAHIVHLDCASSQITPLINIHRHPATFVRLVVGPSSTNERSLGLDKSIQEEPTTSPILERVATTRDSIRGRAATCWRAGTQRQLRTHQTLVDTRVLHGDIPHNDVLLGKEGAPDVTAESNIGTRLFQSPCVLHSSYPRERPPAHDYPDDLESFFYPLTYVFLLYKPDGSRFPSKDPRPSIVYGWGDEDTRIAHSNKHSLFAVPRCSTGSARDRRDEKFGIVDDHSGSPDALEPIHSRRGEHYSKVLKTFNEAIEAVKESAPQDAKPTPPELVQVSLSEAHTSFPVYQSPIVCSSPQPTNSPVQDSAPTPGPFDIKIAPPPPPTTPDNAGLPGVLLILPASSATTQLRRSARIRDLHGAKDGAPTHPRVQVSPTGKSSRPALPSTAPQPNRSERIRKCKLEDDESAQTVPLR
ncbi:hypothetical protein FA13DRAFT_1796531 [Coprinellus micaceus]|uniref:Fungal-type protein kinase domain-containing protein n=1 Tax=Coprinellus micaceus TaxID=71717 RepID=A0A4Y7STQ7_COPMI|nr:hypothetical protein FA13DRAFT_1796531 [Coprinellus micaceus]